MYTELGRYRLESFMECNVESPYRKLYTYQLIQSGGLTTSWYRNCSSVNLLSDPVITHCRLEETG